MLFIPVVILVDNLKELSPQIWSGARNATMAFLQNAKELLHHRREASLFTLVVQVILVVYRASCETGK